MNKLYLIIGVGVGFVLGAAAGRERYLQLRGTMTDLLDRPQVKDAVAKADAFVAEKAPGLHDVGAAVVDAVSSSGESESDSNVDSSTDETSDESSAPKSGASS
jgi:hypothetical protein